MVPRSSFRQLQESETYFESKVLNFEIKSGDPSTQRTLAFSWSVVDFTPRKLEV